MSQYKRTALVLGAGGFIGSHMVKRLRSEGYWVRGVDLKHPEYAHTEANEFIQNLKRENINLPPYLILKNKGLFENTLAIPAAKEMIDCFLEVLLRIDLSKSLKFLSSQQESELLNWDIEIYRQSIN